MTLNRAADPETRRSGIGASDAALVLGVSPWGGPHSVWMEKRGMSAPLMETEAMKWGKILEEPIAREIAREKGWKVRRDNRTLRHPDYSWMFTHLDRRVVTPEGPAILEVKNASAYRSKDFGEPGSDQVPDEYYIQVQHELAVSGAPVAILAALIGGNHLVPYTIHPEPGVIASMIEIEGEFWHENVLRGIPPEPDGSEASAKLLTALHPNDDGTELVVSADDPIVELIDALRTAEATSEAADIETALAKQNIQVAMGDHARLKGPDFKVSWTTVAGAHVPNWRAIAESLLPYAPETYRGTVVEQFTEQRAGYRRFALTDKS